MIPKFLMEKRHLEILGYQVVEVPHFEWNSMSVSTEKEKEKFLKYLLFNEKGYQSAYL